MALDEVAGQKWTRKHDDPATPVVPSAPRTVYPRSLEELIEICSMPPQRLHAAGSHWALSGAALSDSTFVETHDPRNLHQAMGRTLYDVVWPCLSDDFMKALGARTVPPFESKTPAENAGLYPIHVETGKRVYQLYSELDWGDDDPASLAIELEKQGNTTYRGPWAFHTLGGAGGQTVFGALTTGTHGGDFRFPPIADAVMALHLVADGGKHYWIEPASSTPVGAQLTEDDKLYDLYGAEKFRTKKDTQNFWVKRDDDLFNAVLMSAGRFGIVYSIVIAAVPQYFLHQNRQLTEWQSIRTAVTNPTGPLFTAPAASPSAAANRFLQIAVSVTPHGNFQKNLAGVTRRWNVPPLKNPVTGEPAGRFERRGPRVDPWDEAIQAPRFAYAGNTHVYTPDPANPGLAMEAGFLEAACSNADFLAGIIDAAIEEIQDFIDSNGTELGLGLSFTAAAGGGAGLPLLLAAFLQILSFLELFKAVFEGGEDVHLGDVMNTLRDGLLNRDDPEERAAGIATWHMIAAGVFSSRQANGAYSAISYAVMDGHDYLDKSCDVNADSIEVFFDAKDPMLRAFVDGLQAFEVAQELNDAKAFVGYISLRFTGQTRALLGPERFPVTCAVEVAGLRDVEGTTELIDFGLGLALSANFNALVHWGQRNPSTRADIQNRFGDTMQAASGPLRVWREKLGEITDHGRLDGFSNKFSRQVGLEIADPLITSVTVSGDGKSEPVTVAWDCTHNPPDTKVSLQVAGPTAPVSTFSALPLSGDKGLWPLTPGQHTYSIEAAIGFGGEERVAVKSVTASVG